MNILTISESRYFPRKRYRYNIYDRKHGETCVKGKKHFAVVRMYHHHIIFTIRRVTEVASYTHTLNLKTRIHKRMSRRHSWDVVLLITTDSRANDQVVVRCLRPRDRNETEVRPNIHRTTELCCVSVPEKEASTLSRGLLIARVPRHTRMEADKRTRTLSHGCCLICGSLCALLCLLCMRAQATNDRNKSIKHITYMQSYKHTNSVILPHVELSWRTSCSLACLNDLLKPDGWKYSCSSTTIITTWLGWNSVRLTTRIVPQSVWK